jgi:hypothetical protein
MTRGGEVQSGGGRFQRALDSEAPLNQNLSKKHLRASRKVMGGGFKRIWALKRGGAKWREPVCKRALGLEAPSGTYLLRLTAHALVQHISKTLLIGGGWRGVVLRGLGLQKPRLGGRVQSDNGWF